jgi:hypothetical protein
MQIMVFSIWNKTGSVTDNSWGKAVLSKRRKIQKK